jgi:KDO2-lipid IV(A) lauroyltransferase
MESVEFGPVSGAGSPEIRTPVADQGHRAPARNRRGRRRPQVIELKLDRWQRLGFYLLVALIHLISLLPDSVLCGIGIFGGYIAYVLDRRHVRIGMRNLEIAFPERSDPERQRILRESYVNLGRCAAEYVRLAGFFYRRMRERVSYSRLEYWDEMKRCYPGKGALILTAHFGNFELLPAVHAMHGHQISLVHHTQRFMVGDALMTFVRERAGVTIIRKHAAARAVLNGLGQGQMIGIPFDQNAKRSEAIFVPFFNELAATSSGLARLVAIADVPVVPVFLVRDPDQRRHRVEIFDEIKIQHSGDASADIEENTRRFVRSVETIVRRYPEQFLWIHRRYRTRPRGTPQIYDV